MSTCLDHTIAMHICICTCTYITTESTYLIRSTFRAVEIFPRVLAKVEDELDSVGACIIGVLQQLIHV